MMNPPELPVTKFEMMHLLQSQVYDCRPISAHPRLPYQNTKR